MMISVAFLHSAYGPTYGLDKILEQWPLCSTVHIYYV